MSLHISVVSIEGDHVNEIADVLRSCDYEIEDSFTVHTGAQAAKEQDWNPDSDRVAKVAYFAKGWTFLVDPELVLMTDDVWIEFSRRWNNRVVGWVCEGASGSYGLTVFDAGRQRRDVMSVGGELAVNDGEPLAEESNVRWPAICEDDIMDIAKRFGAEFDFAADGDYTVFHLDESQMEFPELPADWPPR